MYACNLGEEEDHTESAKKCGGSDFKIDGKIESWPTRREAGGFDYPDSPVMYMSILNILN